MRLLTLSAIVVLDAFDEALDPALAHLLDEETAKVAASQLVAAGAHVRVEAVEAIVFDDVEALPRLGGRRVKLTASADEAVRAWRERTAL